MLQLQLTEKIQTLILHVGRDALKRIGRAQPRAHTARPRLDGGPGTGSPPLAAPTTSCSSRDTGLTGLLPFLCCGGGGGCRPKLDNGKCWETSDDDDSDDGGKKKKKKKTETK